MGVHCLGCLLPILLTQRVDDSSMRRQDMGLIFQSPLQQAWLQVYILANGLADYEAEILESLIVRGSQQCLMEQ